MSFLGVALQRGPSGKAICASAASLEFGEEKRRKARPRSRGVGPSGTMLRAYEWHDFVSFTFVDNLALSALLTGNTVQIDIIPGID